MRSATPNREVDSLRRERILAVLFVLFLSATLAHFVNDSWARILPGRVPPQSAFEVNGAKPALYAPNAYRVGMSAMIGFFTGPPINAAAHYVFAAFDFVFSAGTLLLLVRFAVRGIRPAAENRGRRALVMALFFAFAQFPLIWVVPWQRPETMPSAFFLAIGLWCVAKADEGIAWTALLVAATLLQSLVRADVPFVFGCGLALAAITGGPGDQALRRRTLLSRGIAIGAVAAAVQLYLQLVKFPGLKYPPSIPLITVRFNLLPHNLMNGLLAVLPVLIGVVPALRVWRKIPILYRGILLSSALYLVLWATVAILDEVRVYVPFLMMLCVVAANACSERLVPENSTVGSTSA